jgi:hypothetical protein
VFEGAAVAGERGTGLESAASDALRSAQAKPAGGSASGAKAPTPTAAGADQPAESEEKVARFYFVPMKGQMGTDVHPSIYEAVVKDIKAKQPDVVVFTIECADYNTIFYLKDDDPTKASLNRLTEYRDMVAQIQEDLRGIRQVVWVEDSVGFSSLVALSWPEIYMTSDARLQGLERVLEPVLGWRDPDVRAKMLAAWTGIAKGLLEKGGHPQELGEAMMRPEKKLSVSFEGREINWLPDTQGHWVLDGSDRFTARFSAQVAEDIGLCAGIADTREDLAFLLGYREWEEVPNSTKIVDDYLEDWRAMLKQVSTWMLEQQDAMRYAAGGEAVKYYGQAIDRLNKIVAAMTKYPAIEVLYQTRWGLNRERIKLEIEKLQEQIRAIKRGPGGGAGGGGGGGASLGGGRGR